MGQPAIPAGLCVALSICWGLTAAPARAHAGAHHSARSAASAAPVGQPWNFTLPTLDGTRFVEASAIKGPVLVNFWGKDCAPCITELPRLHDFAKANPQWTVLLVSTDSPADAQAFVQRHGVQLTVLRPGANVAGLMRSAGNRAGGLPFSVALRVNNGDARICRRHLGELSEAVLSALSSACG